MTLQSEYSRNMKNIYKNQYAAWPAIKSYNLGDYGKLSNDGVLLKYGNVKDLGVDLKIVIDTIPDTMRAGASRGVTVKVAPVIEVSTGHPAIPSAAASIIFEFKKRGDWVIATPAVFYDYIDNELRLQEELRKLYKKGDWDSSYRIVTGLYRMNEAKIFISDSENLELSVNISAELDVPLADFGKASIQASVVKSTGAFMEHNPALNITPMIDIMRLRTIWEWLGVPPYISLRGTDNPDSYILGPDITKDSDVD